jgi:hypothetical protein
VYVAHGRESTRGAEYLAFAVRDGMEIPYPHLRELVQTAGLEPGMPQEEMMRRLEPHRDGILDWLYGEIARQCERQGVLPVLVFLPQLEAGSWQEETSTTLELAEKHGFVVLDLSGVYDGHDLSAVQLTEWDRHPNALGHRLLAERLYQLMTERWDALLSGSRASRAPHPGLSQKRAGAREERIQGRINLVNGQAS